MIWNSGLLYFEDALIAITTRDFDALWNLYRRLKCYELNAVFIVLHLIYRANALGHPKICCFCTYWGCVLVVTDGWLELFTQKHLTKFKLGLLSILTTGGGWRVWKIPNGKYVWVEQQVFVCIAETISNMTINKAPKAWTKVSYE